MTYPQLSTAAFTQLPVRKRRRTRTVVNTTADGRKTKLADIPGQTTEWQLRYTGLSDSELTKLQNFFAAAGGSLTGFTFLDPCGNLLAWSDDLTQPAWQKDPLLSVAGPVGDPTDGANAWHVVNAGAGSQGLSQTLNVPGVYVYCLSVYLRAETATSVTLSLGATKKMVPAGSGWSRATLSASTDASATSVMFGIQLPAGAAIDLFGPQVEPQAAPSAYQCSTTGGVYENARFRDDTFTCTTTDVNRHSVTLSILYANHL